MPLSHPAVRRRAAARLAPVLVAAALAVVSAPAHARQAEQHTIQGERIAIFNLVGTIRAEAGSGSRVEVDVTRGGADASGLRVHQSVHDRTQVLSIAYPGDDIVYAARGRGSMTMLNVTAEGIFGRDWGSRRRVRISGSGNGTEAWADVRVRIPRGQTISLHLAAGEVTVANVEGNVMIDVASADVTTDNTSGTLALDAGSGRATVRNARGQLALDLGSGPITLEGVEASSVLVDAGSGSITGTGLTARELTLDTGSGSVKLSRVSAESVNLDSGSGSVDVELSTTLRSLSIDAGSGSVTVRVPENIGATIEAETGSGGIDTDLQLQVRRMSRDRLSATIGNGQAQVRIDSGSGRIRIIKS